MQSGHSCDVALDDADLRAITLPKWMPWSHTINSLPSLKSILMKLSEEKIDIIQKVIELEDEAKLDQIHELLTKDDNRNNLTESEKRSIERGLKDLDEGRKISYQEFKERLQQWVTS